MSTHNICFFFGEIGKIFTRKTLLIWSYDSLQNCIFVVQYLCISIMLSFMYFNHAVFYVFQSCCHLSISIILSCNKLLSLL